MPAVPLPPFCPVFPTVTIGSRRSISAHRAVPREDAVGHQFAASGRNVDGSAAGVTPALYVRSGWWKLYGDPELNALEQQVRVSNQTIRAAEANFRVSRALVVAARTSLFPTVAASPSATRSLSSQTYSSSGSGGGSGAVVINSVSRSTPPTRLIFGAVSGTLLRRAKSRPRRAQPTWPRLSSAPRSHWRRITSSSRRRRAAPHPHGDRRVVPANP